MPREAGMHFNLLDELDARQDDLLEQIDQLNRRLESLLTQFSGTPGPSVSPPAAGDREEYTP